MIGKLKYPCVPSLLPIFLAYPKLNKTKCILALQKDTEICFFFFPTQHDAFKLIISQVNFIDPPLAHFYEVSCSLRLKLSDKSQKLIGLRFELLFRVGQNIKTSWHADTWICLGRLKGCWPIRAIFPRASPPPFPVNCSLRCCSSNTNGN